MSDRPDDPVLLWALRGHGRDVRCLREPSRGGLELRILWGDELFLTERFSSEAALTRRAQEFRTTLESRGWTQSDPLEKPQPATTSLSSPPASAPGAGVAAPPPDSPARPAGADAAADRSLSPSVLVVDDEPAIRTFMRDYLEAVGYRVRDAEDVDLALAVLDEGGIDAVVLDVRMPDRMGWGRTGLEVLAFMRLHAAYAELPVFVLTGHPLSDEELGIIRRHRAHLFMKPDGYRTLLGRLNELTGHIPGSQH